MIRVEGVSKSFGPTRVLDGVDLDVEGGEVVLLLGANGAGKSTLFRCLLGLLPYEGSIEVEGFDPLRQGPEVRRRIGYMPQRDGLHGDLTVTETLDFYGELRDVPRARRRSLLTETRLTEAADAKVDELSGGMRQRLAFALALLDDPPVLLLDEPTASLDGWSRGYLIDQVARLAERGKAIVLSTHAEQRSVRSVGRPLTLRGGRLIGAEESV